MSVYSLSSFSGFIEKSTNNSSKEVTSNVNEASYQSDGDMDVTVEAADEAENDCEIEQTCSYETSDVITTQSVVLSCESSSSIKLSQLSLPISNSSQKQIITRQGDIQDVTFSFPTQQSLRPRIIVGGSIQSVDATCKIFFKRETFEFIYQEEDGSWVKVVWSRRALSCWSVTPDISSDISVTDENDDWCRVEMDFKTPPTQIQTKTTNNWQMLHRDFPQNIHKYSKMSFVSPDAEHWSNLKDLVSQR